MTERDDDKSEDPAAQAGDQRAQRPAQHAALDEEGGGEEEVPQDSTKDTRWDTEQHSDAPGPTGTG